MIELDMKQLLSDDVIHCCYVFVNWCIRNGFGTSRIVISDA